MFPLYVPLQIAWVEEIATQFAHVINADNLIPRAPPFFFIQFVSVYYTRWKSPINTLLTSLQDLYWQFDVQPW